MEIQRKPSSDDGDARLLRLRFPGNCASCGIPLPQGTNALFDRRLKTVQCVVCPADPEGNAEAGVDDGVAGASATREFDRLVAGRKTRLTNRFGHRLAGVYLAVSSEPQSTRAWAQGAEGERALAEALAGVEGIQVLHDRRMPGGRGNIDHIVVGPAGVFVVDAKLYEGQIRIRDVGGFFKRDDRLYVGRWDCSQLADKVVSQLHAVDEVLRAAGAQMPPTAAVLCFVRGEWPLIFPPSSFRGVRLEGTNSIKKLVSAVRVLDGPTIERLTRSLRPVVRANRRLSESSPDQEAAQPGCADGPDPPRGAFQSPSIHQVPPASA